MQSIIIDEEFKSLLPALDIKTFELLEENLLRNGCLDSLVLWGDILIDGHNRYEICVKHDIPFDTINKEFGSREEVLIWIITTQVARRNLNPRLLSYYRGLHYRTDKKVITNDSGKNQYGELDGHNAHQPKALSTAGKLSQYYKINEKTVRLDAKASEAIDAIGEVSPEAKRMILAEEVKIDKKALQALASASKEELAEVAAQIEDCTFENRKPDAQTAAESGNANPVSSGPWPLRVALNNMTEDFYSSLRRLTKNGDPAELKMALRSCIDMLEVLYKQI